MIRTEFDAAGVTRRRAVNPRDHVRWEELIAIALAGLSVGLGLMVGVAQFSKPTETTASAATDAPDPQPAEDVEVAHNAPNAEREVQTAPAPSAAPMIASTRGPSAQPAVASEPTAAAKVANAPEPQPAAAEPTPTAASAPADRAEPEFASSEPPNPKAAQPAATQASAAVVAVASNKPGKRATARHFKFGLVVYPRCDGLMRKNKHAACPRDRQLELQVWQVLETLEQCRSDPGIGEAELRLTLRRRGAPVVDLAAVKGVRSLNLRAVSQCAGPGLAKVRTRLRSPHAVVTFRFNMS